MTAILVCESLRSDSQWQSTTVWNDSVAPGNKGVVGAGFHFGLTSFALVGAHLAADMKAKGVAVLSAHLILSCKL